MNDRIYLEHEPDNILTRAIDRGYNLQIVLVTRFLIQSMINETDSISSTINTNFSSNEIGSACVRDFSV